MLLIRRFPFPVLPGLGTILLTAACAGATASREPPPAELPSKRVAFRGGPGLRPHARAGRTHLARQLRLDDYEPERGRLDVEWLRRFAELAQAQGITLRPYLGYTAPWAALGREADGQTWNDSPARLADWRGFVTALAAAHTALAAAAPDVGLLHGGVVWPDAEWLETICDAVAATRISAIAFQAYPETWTPDSVTVENYLEGEYRTGFLPAVDACVRRPIWINEMGYATIPGRTEHQQADPRVAHIGIYET